MKQPKKRWAWKARQRGREATYRSFDYRHHQPNRWLRCQEWKLHRSRTREVIHRILRGADEATVEFLYHHKYNAHWLAW